MSAHVFMISSGIKCLIMHLQYINFYSCCTFGVCRCLNCNLGDVVCEPNGRKAGRITQRLHITIVASCIALKVFVWIVSAVLAFVFLNKNLLVDLQDILVPFSRLGLDVITRSQEHVVINISACFNASSLHKYLNFFPLELLKKKEIVCTNLPLV